MSHPSQMCLNQSLEHRKNIHVTYWSLKSCARERQPGYHWPILLPLAVTIAFNWAVAVKPVSSPTLSPKRREHLRAKNIPAGSPAEGQKIQRFSQCSKLSKCWIMEGKKKSLTGHSPECAELPFSGLIPFRTDVASAISGWWRKRGRTPGLYTAKMASIVICPKKAKEQWKL